MRKFLVNSTYCIYLSDIRQLYFDSDIATIIDVVEEVKHEREILIEAPLVPARKTSLEIRANLLSNTDLLLLQTAKVMNYVLVTDDQKLIATAHKNGVQPLDTPHFIHLLLIKNKWSEEKTMDVLNQLKPVYNRIYIIDKVIKDIRNWRG